MKLDEVYKAHADKIGVNELDEIQKQVALVNHILEHGRVSLDESGMVVLQSKDEHLEFVREGLELNDASPTRAFSQLANAMNRLNKALSDKGF
jgi:hypothetical protein